LAEATQLQQWTLPIKQAKAGCTLLACIIKTGFSTAEDACFCIPDKARFSGTPEGGIKDNPISSDVAGVVALAAVGKEDGYVINAAAFVVVLFPSSPTPDR